MELTKVKLSDVARVEISGVDKKSKPGQKSVRLCNFVDVYHNWAITQDMRDSFMKATASDKEIEALSIKKGQVAFTKDSETRDDIGIPTYIADDFDDVVLGYHNALITPDERKLNGKYLNAFMHSSYIQKYFENNASGSGQRYTLSNDTVNSIPILLPTIKEQEKIGNLFSFIDRKIALNKKMNQKLEAMAKRLYDYWFVQYDFPDKNGHPYKTTGGPMTYNEVLKREIPAGWEVKTLDEYLDCNKYSLTAKSSYDFIQYLDTSSLTENTLESLQRYGSQAESPSRAKRIVHANDILYSTVRPQQKHYGIIKNPAQNMIASTGFAILSCKYGAEYNDMFYLFLIQEKNLIKLSAIADSNASSYPSFNPSDLLDLTICLPNDLKIIEPLVQKFSSLFSIVERNQKENQKLIALRDKLLPLLMNGQVVVG